MTLLWSVGVDWFYLLCSHYKIASQECTEEWIELVVERVTIIMVFFWSKGFRAHHIRMPRIMENKKV